MLARRRLLSLLGMAPIAGPSMARQAMEAMTAELAGVTTTGLGSAGPTGDSPSAVSEGDSRKALRRLLQTPAHRDEYESLMFERRRYVGAIDIDIANKRSFSMAAKIAFQRQRNVEREIAEDAAETPLWRRTEECLRRLAGWPT